MNIVESVLFHAKLQPSAPAILPSIAGGQAISYQQLDRFIENFISHIELPQRSPRTVVALAFRDPILHIVALLSCMKIGLVTLSAHGHQLPEKLKLDAIFSDLRDFSKEGLSTTLVGRNWLLERSQIERPVSVDEASDGDYCRMFLTSGTTGEPKAVALTYGQVAKRLLQRETIFGRRFSECSRIFIGLGFSTVPGFTALLHALSKGNSVVLEGPNPAATVKAIVENGVQALLASPQTIAGIFKLYKEYPSTTPKLDVIVPFGSSVSPRFSESLRSGMCHQLFSMYGSTELASVAVSDSQSVSDIEGAVGYIAPRVTIDVLDDLGRKLPFGEFGRIRIRSEFAGAGYVEKDLDSVVEFPRDGVCPGDLGTVTPDGILIISGRENSLMNLGGTKVSPERVERALLAFSHIGDAAVLSLANGMGIQQLVGVVVWPEDTDQDASRRLVRKHLELTVSAGEIPHLFVEVKRIPRNHMGKIDRELLKREVVEILRKTEELKSAQAAAS